MKKACVLLAPVLLFAPAGVSAQDEQPVSSLDTVTVIGTKSPTKTFDFPGMASVIDTSEPGVAGASRVKDLLRDVPGIGFSGSARRNGQALIMRGYNSDGLVILIDGVRQRFEAAHDGKFFVDPALLKSVKVVRGPHSALYGSGGLGGVVAFATREASDLLKPGQKAGAVTTVNFQGVNSDRLISQIGAWRTGRSDIVANAVLRRSDDIELGDSSELSSEDDVMSALLKAGWSATPFSTFKANLQTYRNDSEEPNHPGLNPNDPNFTPPLSDLYRKHTETQRVSVGYLYNNPARPLIDLKTRLYHNQIEVDERNPRTGRSLARRLRSVGASIENQGRFETAFGSHVLTIGADYYQEDQNGEDSSTMSGEAGGIPDAESRYRGVFVQDQIEWVGGFGKLLIIAGALFDDYRLNSDDLSGAVGSSLNESRTSPKLGITYQPRGWLTLFGSYARAFRAPTLTERYTTGVHFSLPEARVQTPRGEVVLPGGNNVFVPNPNLKPEKNAAFEYGFGMRFDGWLKANDALQFKLARFEINNEDFLDLEVNTVRRPVIPGRPGSPGVCCGTSRQINVPDADLHGVELDGGYENERVKFTLSYAQITGKNKDTDEYLFNTMPPTWVANLALKLPAINAVSGWRATFAARHNKVKPPDSANDLPNSRGSYDTHDVYLRWQPGRARGGLTVDLGVDNLFDEQYERVFAGSLEPGRNYKARISYQL